MHTAKVLFLYYFKKNDKIFFIQGLVSIQPYYSDRFLMSNVGMAGIIILMNSFLDLENIIFGKYHYVLYYLSLAIYPRMLFTVKI